MPKTGYVYVQEINLFLLLEREDKYDRKNSDPLFLVMTGEIKMNRKYIVLLKNLSNLKNTLIILAYFRSLLRVF